MGRYRGMGGKKAVRERRGERDIEGREIGSGE